MFQTLLNYGDLENQQNTPWYQHKNLGLIFNHAGYRTFWLDNQERASRSDVFALSSHIFTHAFYTSAPYHTYDSLLIDLFKEKVQPRLSNKNFILFHLIGNHLGYAERFPKAFAKFTPADIPYQGLHVQDEKDKQIVADYVNSLYYTDYILSEIFKLFENKDAVIIYLSDHAQDIFESNQTYGHRCSSFGVEIPFVIYVSDLFKQKHPEKLKQLAQAVHKPFMSDDLIHTLLPLVGIHTKDNLESKDLLSSRFDTTRVRKVCAGVEYFKRSHSH